MKRLLSILLVTMLVIGLVPAMASAAEVQVVDFMVSAPRQDRSLQA